MSNTGGLSEFARGGPGVRLVIVHRLQDLTGINPIEKTTLLVDVIPRHVFYWIAHAGIFRLVRPHNVLPEGLGHRCRRHVEIMDLDWPAIWFTAKEISPAACAANPHEVKRVLFAVSTPLIRQCRHSIEVPVYQSPKSICHKRAKKHKKGTKRIEVSTER